MTTYVKPSIKMLMTEGEALLNVTITEKIDDAEDGRIIFGAKGDMPDENDYVSPTNVWDD